MRISLTVLIAAFGSMPTLAGAACSHIKGEELWRRAFHTRISRYRDRIGLQRDKLVKGVNETCWMRWKAPAPRAYLYCRTTS